MATATAKSGVIAVAMILAMCVASAAAGDDDKLPAAFDILQQPAKEAASLGYGCFTRCYAGCFAAGFDGNYCSEFCSEECGDDVRKLRAIVGDIGNVPRCISDCIAAKIDAPYCKIWCEDMCGDDIRKNQSGLSP
ncbi:hypothetical protein E2562_022146 [Oryza meyeriana var. granulata]|uniref:Uncharacterized protein n=1 Tax=Oryza meyeriana var. granulata TaxID=110450 RepID=A0A6G1DLI9_9ORYZ|nr:hypothetical protein E2562_022146 [Oryza meyeriana var. granulata]